jgi:hypothetical protein
MLKRRDVKGLNRREGAEADTVKNSGMMAMLIFDKNPCLEINERRITQVTG